VSLADGGAGVPLAIDPTVIAEADLNGDGYPYLVVGNFNSGGVLLDVLLGKRDGPLPPPRAFPRAVKTSFLLSLFTCRTCKISTQTFHL
jgi:hypothetical protein